ncbi:acyl-CoA dehydrogenase family protein [Dactylosporangium sp. NPDC051484]|uniref:acyl-CoA dehydrogenase family protein n=1 Tax=Dactylosporangium sp. NPDC051484 TaxID=3154942 RepID=UPI00344C4BA8
MDFTLDETAQAAKELAARIFADFAAGPETAGSAHATGDLRLRSALAEAGLLGLHLPAEHGGADLGLAAATVVLEEQGRVTAGAPLWPLLTASYALAHFAPEPDRLAWLGAADGAPRATVALEEFGPADPWAPEAVAQAAGDGWRLSGTKAAVPLGGGDAGAVLVSASAGGRPGLFLVDALAPGLAWEPTSTTDLAPAANLDLRDVPATRLGDGDGDDGAEAVLAAVLDVAVLGVCATQIGVMRGALALAASYLSQRHQFGRPLATFQAVQHKLADCYMDIEATAVTLWQAVSDVDERAARRATSVPVAQWWSAQAGLDVVHRTQHLHGGIGLDIDFPAHRFYLWARQLAGTLGADRDVLTRLGDRIASGESEWVLR